ncbi:MAG: hypothetical protein QOK46_906 [Microbacteriaceae bacterium]|jgi:hypothetical protein|nr:hypothetical protein [Microbacteriaceae bacterium]
MRPYPERRTTERAPTLRRLVEPWTLILVITGLFQLLRGAPVDAAFFLVIATLLMADAAGLLWFAGTGLPRRGLIVVTAILLGLLLVLVPRHGAAAGIVVGTAGIGLLALAWSPSPPPQSPTSRAARVVSARVVAARPVPARPSGISRSAIAWTAIAIAGCLWEVATFLLGLPSPAASTEHPSISILLDPVLGSAGGKIGFVAVWLIVLVWLLRRTGAR